MINYIEGDARQRYEYNVEGDYGYGHGWEVVTAEETREVWKVAQMSYNLWLWVRSLASKGPRDLS